MAAESTISCFGSLERGAGGYTIGDSEWAALGEAQKAFEAAYSDINAWTNAIQCAEDCVETKVLKWWNREPWISGRPGDVRKVEYKGRIHSRTLDYFEASYGVFCRVTCSLLDSQLDDWPAPSHYHSRPLRLAGAEPVPEVRIPHGPRDIVRLAPVELATLYRLADPRSHVPIPKDKQEIDEDGNLVVTHGHLDPVTGKFLEDLIDTYELDGGVVSRLLRRVIRLDGHTVTVEFIYDEHGRMVGEDLSGDDGEVFHRIRFRYDSEGRFDRVEEIDGKGKVLRVTVYKYDSDGRCYRKEETDGTGRTLKVTTYAYFADGSVRVTVTDYSTEPARVTEFTVPPPPEPLLGPI